MSNNPTENSEQVRDLERAILGGLMLETERYDAVSEIIEFSDSINSTIQFQFRVRHCLLTQKTLRSSSHT